MSSSLTPEDGTGLADADSYVSSADADVYHADFDNAAWAAATDEAKDAALRRATQYIDTRYTFRGEPLKTTQALQWPRIDVPGLADDDWPVRRLSDAVCELALRALSTSLYADQTVGQIKAEKIGPIETEYFGTGLPAGQTGFTIVDKLLAPYTGGGALSMRLARAS